MSDDLWGPPKTLKDAFRERTIEEERKEDEINYLKKKAYYQGFYDAVIAYGQYGERRKMAHLEKIWKWRHEKNGCYELRPEIEHWDVITKRILERDDYECEYCGGKAEEADHHIPVAHDGSDEDSNLVAACHVCNNEKNDIYPDPSNRWLRRWKRDQIGRRIKDE